MTFDWITLWLASKSAFLIISACCAVCVFVYVLVPDLCGTDDRLASRVATSNHHLLGDEDFLRRDLNPEVAPGNHHAVTLSQDLLKTDREIREWGVRRQRIESLG